MNFVYHKICQIYETIRFYLRKNRINKTSSNVKRILENCDMKRGIKIHPLNAKGQYYIDQNVCLICEDCFHAAPNNFCYNNEGNYGYYVAKQPENFEEEEQCKEALISCPLEAIHNDGENLEWGSLD